MPPRNTHNGAAANARKGAGTRSPRVASSSRTSTRGGSRTATKAKSVRTASSAKTPARPATSAKQSGARTKPRTPARAARRDWPWWAMPAAIVLAVAVFGWTYYPVARVQYRETREKQRLQAELESLQARNERLRGQVERLKTPAGVEDYARSQLGMVKRGENAVVVVEPGAEKPSTLSTAAPVIDSDVTTEGPTGPWTAFLDLVFGLE